jgi:hypothetical protein
MSFIINPLTKRSALILHPTPSTATRTVVHHARPPRRQRQPTPLNPLVVSPTPGTSRPQPTRSSKPSSRSTVTLLSDTNIELHHAPAPSAPSYNVGNVPDILRWVAGVKDVRRSGQASAEWIRPNRRIQWEKDVSISQQVVDEMRKLREENPQRWSRSALMRKYVSFDSFLALVSTHADTPSLLTTIIASTDSQSRHSSHPSFPALYRPPHPTARSCGSGWSGIRKRGVSTSVWRGRRGRRGGSFGSHGWVAWWSGGWWKCGEWLAGTSALAHRYDARNGLPQWEKTAIGEVLSRNHSHHALYAQSRFSQEVRRSVIVNKHTMHR